MKIYLGNNYYLNSDTQCFWITQEYEAKRKNGNTYLNQRVVSGYHRNFRDAIISCVENRIRSLEVTELLTLAESVENLKKDISLWKSNIVAVKAAERA